MTVLRRAATDDRAVYLVQPRFPPSIWGMDYVLPLTPYHAVLPPLGLLTLAALTPPDFRVTICDENAGEPVDYDTPARVVGITGYLLQRDLVFRHAAQFRKRGKTVVLGGPLANLLPELCRGHCDVLFEGEAEYTWPRFLHAFAHGRWADHYLEADKVHMPDSPAPRLDLLRRRYLHGIVQSTRGCPFTCEFCDIIVMFGRKVRVKAVDQVMREVGAWHRAGVATVFFSDDNFVGNRAYAKEVLRALAAWNARQRRALSFYTQASIDMVRDAELLALMRDANFSDVFIGIESPRKASLAEARKGQNEKLDLVDAVHTIQAHNLFVMAGMIAGFDHDDAGIFDEHYEFCQRAQIPIVMNNTLTAAPKTPLTERLRAEGRLLEEDWSRVDVATEVRPGVTNFRPLNMTADQLEQGQKGLIRRLYGAGPFAERLSGNLGRFRDVRFLSESVNPGHLASLLRLAGFYTRERSPVRTVFWRSLWSTLVRQPRRLVTVSTILGMYAHILQLYRLSRA
jgi:radical SAM superfamily enzyme YgiQ (UPF0313 family)